MIVEQVGRNDVLVRYRDSNGNRKQEKITEFLPYCYVRDEDAQWIHEKKESGYTGVFGTPLTKVTCFTTDGIRNISKTGKTWEGNVPFTNQVLTARVKAGEKPFASYEHRVWYLDGEWKTDSGQITMLTVYDNFTDNTYSWAVLPNGVAKGKYKMLIDANGNECHYDVPIIVFDTEAELLTHFTAFMRKQDPDIITGWYVTGG